MATGARTAQHVEGSAQNFWRKTPFAALSFQLQRQSLSSVSTVVKISFPEFLFRGIFKQQVMKVSYRLGCLEESNHISSTCSYFLPLIYSQIHLFVPNAFQSVSRLTFLKDDFLMAMLLLRIYNGFSDL